MNHRLFTRFLSIVAPLPLVGCLSLGPDFQAPEWDGPEAWSGDASTAPLPDGAPWWSVFNDPVLDALEAELLEQNPSLAAAIARLDASAAQLGIARAAYAPSVSLSGSAAYDRQSGEANGSSTIPDNPDWFFKPGASFSWELDFWGRVRRNVEAAAAGGDLGRCRPGVAARPAGRRAPGSWRGGPSGRSPPGAGRRGRRRTP